MSIRRQLGLGSGDRLQWLVQDDHIVVVPVKGSVTELRGMVAKPSRPIGIEDFNQALEEEATARHGGEQSLSNIVINEQKV